MLGFSPVSGRAVSGSSGLTAVAAALVASGALLTFGGTTNPGYTLPATASGSILAFNGTANAFWLASATTTGNFITLGGSPAGELLGNPITFYAAQDRLEFVAQADNFTFSAVADTITFRGMR